MIKILAVLLLTYGSQSYGQSYGAAMKDRVSAIQLSQIAKEKPSKLVEVRGQVKKVCKKKGCWAVVDDGSGDVRMTFKDYSFFVPLKLVGKTIRAQGFIKKITRTVNQQKHFLKDGGAKEADIAGVTQDQLVYEFEASSVQTIDGKS